MAVSAVTRNAQHPTLAKLDVLKQRYGRRNWTYKKLYQYYEGYYTEATNQSQEELEALRGIKLIYNRMYTTVRNYTNYMSQPPDIQIYPRTQEEKGYEQADKIEKLLYALWDDNAMALRLMEAAWYQSCAGMAVMKAQPDPYGKKILITTCRPEDFYPAPRGGDYSKFKYVFYVNRMTGEAARDYFGNVIGDVEDTEEYEVVEYWDDNQYLVFFNNEQVKGIEHGFGFIPFIAVPGNLRPHQVHGLSDIEQAVGLNQYVNELLSLKADIIELNADPPVVIQGSKLGPADIPTGPGAVIELEVGGKAYYLVSASNLRDIDVQMAQVVRDLEDLTGMPEPTMGRVQPSVESAKAIESLMGGLSVSIASRQLVLGVYLSRLNSYILQMVERLYPDDELEFYGERKGQAFTLKMKGKEIDGYYRNKIIWRPGIYDTSTYVVTQLQLLGAGLQSKYTTMENIGIRSPQDERRRILEEKKQELLMQQELQEFQAPGEVEKQKKSLEQGGIPPALQGIPGIENLSPDQLNQILALYEQQQGLAPTSSSPGGGLAPPPVPLMGQTGPSEKLPKITTGNIIRRLGKVKFRGQVWMIGELADKGFTEGAVELAIIDEADREPIMTALGDYADRVQIQVVTERPEGGVRVRGAK